MSTTSKETIYVDVDDEITSIIDKVEVSKQKIVALVLPKRAAVLQSIVNMRLLRRSAETADKNIVLITNDPGILPLAGAVGLHVAKNLQSKPGIPPEPDISTPSETVADKEEGEAEETEELDSSKPVGELAGIKEPEDTETIALDDEQDEKEPASKDKEKPRRKDKRLKVPNFDRFRVLLLLGGIGLVGLIALFILMFSVLPKAKLTIKTDSTSVQTDLTATTSGSAKKLDEDKKIIPSQIKETKESKDLKVAATGKKDIGKKATGTIEVRNCDYPAGITLPAGTQFTGANDGKAFVSTDATEIPAFTSPSSSSCDLDSSDSGQANVPVEAFAIGSNYNISSQSYAVQTIPSSAKIDAIGSAMTKGTNSKLVTVVSQHDIDTAVQKNAAQSSTAQQVFYDQLAKDGFFVFQEAAKTSTPKVTASPAVNQEASDVTVTSEVTYSVLVVKETELEKLLINAVNKRIDATKQEVSDKDILKQATVRLSDKKSDTDATVTISKAVVVTPIPDEDSIKQLVAGKKRGEIQSLLTSYPGVKDVSIDFSPFWVNKVPGKSGKVTVLLEQSDSQNDSNQ